MAYPCALFRDFGIDVYDGEFFLDGVYSEVCNRSVFVAEGELVDLVEAYCGGERVLGFVEDASELAYLFGVLCCEDGPEIAGVEEH